MPIRQDDNQPNRRFGIINIVLIGVGALLLFSSLFPNQNMQIPRVPYSLFIDQVNDGEVKRAYITQEQIRYELNGAEEGAPSVLATTPIFDMDLPQRLENKGVEFAAAPPKKPNIFSTILSWVVPPLIFILVLQFFARRSMGGGGAQGALSFTKSKAKVYVPDDESKITFDDVAGVDEAKDELTEIVDFLKKPERYTDIGARIPKGVLLVGPPGTGKTLLSKAVAGEAEVPFFIISGSEFVELFVGAGAARVRDLFEQAKKKAPCIIFIDELDAIGKSRSGSMGVVGGNDEREQTLNQLLTEMDGFTASDKPVIVLAATNQPEVLDAALLRPGRFDRQVVVSNPDIIGREKILKVHVKKIKMAPDVNLRTVARGTPGFSGADLANLVNEAALLAARKNKRIVTLNEFEESKDKVMMGSERRSMVMTEEEKTLTAYHEAGHAIVTINESAAYPIHKATIIPRGRALGMVMQLPERDELSQTREQLHAQLAIAMGGRVAEEIIFGEDKVTTGASSDIEQATKRARAMVMKAGLSKELGPVAYGENEEEVFLGRSVAKQQNMSEETARKVDSEIRKIVEKGYERARKVLTEKIDDLHKLAKALLTYETLSGEEIENLINKNIYPTDKQDLKVDDDKSSALSAMGLKPKIVH